MTKAFSVASWNVEHFKEDRSRVERVVDFLKKHKPDIFALYEVEGSVIFKELVQDMKDYTFHITEGPQVQEILLGIRQGLTAFFTQKIEFKSGATAMRPGALLTVTVADKHYPLLFLHTASGNDPRGLGLRDDMMLRAVDFRKSLDKAAKKAGGDSANYIFLGDFNTMGMEYKFVKGRDISAADELTKLEKQAKKRNMRLLSKSAPATWSNGSKSSIPDSNLDHVVAADHLVFTQFDGSDVSVRGWAEKKTTQEKDEWIRQYSDHSLLYFEVHKV
ncbi:MAG: endonuclease/exonuclease/phosphatase family protein [Anaerolineales bacterium]|jgi:endonuclease/exonuclease/phosphatase family metal-dependent hydrolase|nr:endonuclease/exonuclease/phosphatase family protein [Anaerolineales bacterium]MCC6985674.1 endonuclease/exonuclease/phosphatase family protein [Anaerolineales bacterium]